MIKKYHQNYPKRILQFNILSLWLIYNYIANICAVLVNLIKGIKSKQKFTFLNFQYLKFLINATMSVYN